MKFITIIDYSGTVHNVNTHYIVDISEFNNRGKIITSLHLKDEDNKDNLMTIKTSERASSIRQKLENLE